MNAVTITNWTDNVATEIEGDECIRVSIYLAWKVSVTREGGAVKVLVSIDSAKGYAEGQTEEIPVIYGEVEEVRDYTDIRPREATVKKNNTIYIKF